MLFLSIGTLTKTYVHFIDFCEFLNSNSKSLVIWHAVISVDCDKRVVMKGIDHGASDFMVKPVCTHELKNIWQHVQRWRNPKAISHISDHDNDVQRVQPATADKSKLSGHKRNAGDDSNKHNESTSISTTHRKPRVTWTIKLHNKFLEAINQIGLDRAVPKKVLELMNVDCLSRENIASHLQKYRLHLKRVNSNPSGDAHERWNSSYNMNNKGNFMHNHEHGRWGASSGDTASWSTNNYGAMGHLAPPMNTQSNFYMGSYLHDGRMPSCLMAGMEVAFFLCKKAHLISNLLMIN
uniref:HTH myb-type domain-containing protein n=1 Tax=Aegilops tauschii subsp. strangulata TaxID=200361 RepID=A0A453GK92_AEGTS